MTIFLNRHTGLDCSVRVRFNLKVGSSSSCDGGADSGSSNAAVNSNSGQGNEANGGGSSSLESGVRDEMSDADGRSYGWLPRAKMSDFVSKGTLRLTVEMFSVNTVRKGGLKNDDQFINNQHLNVNKI